MYTLEQLQQKNLKELKEIGWELNVVPEGDRRCRQNWIDALISVQPPLLQLLEVSPGVEVEPVAEAIEIQRQEPIESKFGRIVYPKASIKPIAQTAINGTISDVEPRPASADFHHSLASTAKPDGDSSSDEAASLGSQKGDRVLALARDSQGSQGRALLDRPNELTATFNDEQPPNRGDGKERLESEPKLSQSAIGFCAPPVTFSARFLATYPPYFGEVHYKADTDGQLNLLESVETDDEPPDPDDFELLEDFRRAIVLWDAKHPEPLEVSLDSFCEWAPCPDDWYEPEPSEVSEHSPAPESSITCNFSIPTFDAWCDRANRQTNSDEPPDTGSFARLPGPKPPKFPPMSVVAGDRASRIKKFARSAALVSGRAPPGGDVM
ncbi:hypothetical protein QUB75_19770 [Microcoleus sp. K1-B6]|uniref:hypothetical protein n=1 Tax=Microcoleus sp. K1-B6 TaxID=2818787 RepID=UPI002FD8627F